MSGFNTTRWSIKLIVGNGNVAENVGFGLNYRHRARYFSQPFLVAGPVPAYGTLDAQRSFLNAAAQVRLKLGASNVLNDYNALRWAVRTWSGCIT